MTAIDSESAVSGADDLQQVLDDTRRRFVDGFAAQCDAICALVDDIPTLGPAGPLATLGDVVHRLNGLAGTIGFPTVSIRAAELEDLIGDSWGGVFDVLAARRVVDTLREGFGSDLASPPDQPLPSIAPGRGVKVLVTEDESDLRTIVATCLTRAGYVPIAVPSGDVVAAMARAEKPELIVLDVAMPGLDGYSVCRQLKADPELAHIPVMFLTASVSFDDKLAGLAMGADEFLCKPVDLRELVMRVQYLLQRTAARHAARFAAPFSASKELPYEAFLALARAEIARGGAAAVAIIRLPPDRRQEGALILAGEMRGRDVIGTYGPSRLLILMPDMTAAAARDRLETVVDRLVAHGLEGVCAGVTAAVSAGVKTEEVLIGEADEALAEARYLGRHVATWSERSAGRSADVPAIRMVVVAEDDPDIARVLDAEVRAAGYQAIVAFDGEQALASVRAHAPDVLVLDLMMPKLHGFGVLTQIHDAPPPWPRTIVLSGRGNEQDVMRAFELGADDYMTKPFNPQELIARIVRLLR